MIYNHHIYVRVNIIRDVSTAYKLPGTYTPWGVMEKKLYPRPGGDEEIMIFL